MNLLFLIASAVHKLYAQDCAGKPEFNNFAEITTLSSFNLRKFCMNLERNVGRTDKNIRIGIGILLIVIGLFKSFGLVILGIVVLATGLLSFCGLYKLLGINTASKAERTTAKTDLTDRASENFNDFKNEAVETAHELKDKAVVVAKDAKEEAAELAQKAKQKASEVADDVNAKTQEWKANANEAASEQASSTVNTTANQAANKVDDINKI